MSDQHAANRRSVATAVAAGAAGAALAAGAIWLAGNSSTQATAQAPGQPVSRAEFTRELRAANDRASAAINLGRTSWNQLGRYLHSPANDLIGARSGPIAALRSTGNTGVPGTALADAGVTGPKVADAAITGPKVADAAITGPKVADAAITGHKVADGAIDGPKIAPGSVGEDKLAPSVTQRLPLWAMVSASGIVLRGSPGVSATRLAVGDYRVDFGRGVVACGVTATPFNSQVSGAAGIAVHSAPQDANAVRVRTRQPATANTAQDREFMIQVTC
jgi:hypothetical protein